MHKLHANLLSQYLMPLCTESFKINHFNNSSFIIVRQRNGNFALGLLMCCGTCHAEQAFPVPLPADRVARFSLSAKRSASRLVQSMTDLTGFRSDGIHAANEHSRDLMRSISDLQVWWWVPCSVFSIGYLSQAFIMWWSIQTFDLEGDWTFSDN